VCGGCLNRRAIGSLERLGVLAQLQAIGCASIQSLHLQILETSVQWVVPQMLSVRRSSLDTMLVAESIRNGAQFIDQAHGQLVEPETDPVGLSESHPPQTIRIRVQKEDTINHVHAKSVLVASGLTRSSLKNSEKWPSQVHEGSRIGVQCLVRSQYARFYADNQLHMLVGRNGYVGICKTDGDYVDIAAALDPGSIQPLGGIEQVVRGILSDCNAQAMDWPDTTHWMATPALTRTSQRAASHRVFLIGDALGYVEPFTGEGMSWALAGAEAVIPFVKQISQHGWRDEMAEQWNDRACQQRMTLQRTCRWLANRLRRPKSAAWVLQACNWIPPLRATIIRKTTQ
jgi:menaquinone-9 beta-reductase